MEESDQLANQEVEAGVMANNLVTYNDDKFAKQEVGEGFQLQLYRENNQ